MGEIFQGLQQVGRGGFLFVLQFWGLQERKKSQPWKTSTTFDIKVNGCVPFLKRACASWILSRTVGHFSLVLAFGKNRRTDKIFAQLGVCMPVCMRMCMGVHAPFGYYEAMPRVQMLPYSKSLLLHCPDSRATPSWLCLKNKEKPIIQLKKKKKQDAENMTLIHISALST